MKIHFLYFFIQLFNYFFIHFLSSSHKHLNRYMPSIPYKNRANKVLVASSHSPFQNLPFGQKQGTLRVNVHSFKCKTSNMQTNPKFYKNTKMPSLATCKAPRGCTLTNFNLPKQHFIT